MSINTTNPESIQLNYDPKRVPRHIAVIMDGNGRWARERGMPRLEGHRQGYKTLKKVVMAAADLNIGALTAYTFSSENWKRPKAEVEGLMRLIKFAAKAELAEMKNEGVKIVVSGRVHELPTSVQKQLQEDVDETASNSRIVLNIAVNYGGRNEIIDAAKQAARASIEGLMRPEDINEDSFSLLMYHPELPDPDLLIRTAGELRISNFLLWQCAYSEIHVTDTFWPDFGKEDLIKAVIDYQNRTRKFGTVVE